jgi:hypothetical protein
MSHVEFFYLLLKAEERRRRMNIERKPHTQPLSCFLLYPFTGIGISTGFTERRKPQRDGKMSTVLAVLAEWGIEALANEADMSQAAFM